MLDRMINTGIFGGVAALVGFVLAFGILKIFKISKPHEHKMFFPILAAGMLFAYFLRAYARTMR